MSKRTRGIWALVVGLAGACGGTSNQAGPDGEPRTATEVPPAVDRCAPFHFEYGPRPESGECPALSCECHFFFTHPSALGCLVAADCEAVCAGSMPGPPNWCVNGACRSDDDCPASKCLFGLGSSVGACQSVTGSCYEDADCPDNGACVAVDEEGQRACEARRTFDLCNADDDCDSGNCALVSGSFVGQCTEGEVRHRCESDRDCRRDLHCDGTSCTDGQHESPCAADDDCREGYCADGTCSDGRDEDACNRDDDCESGICVGGIRCHSGELGASCDEDDDCHSGFCVARDWVCTDGSTGSTCFDDGDCSSGSCGETPLASGAHVRICD